MAQARQRIPDGLRLALTTFTVLPVRAGRVDRATAGWAMTFAPLAGLAAGAAQAGVLILAHRPAGLAAPVAAVLAVVAGALFTRGLHLDGLADLADGLGSHRPPAGALAVMTRSDIGPFGVATLVLTLAAQVAALAQATAGGHGGYACLTAAVTGRLAVTWACRCGVPAARPDGLGALVAGTVGTAAALIGTVIVAAAAFAVSPRYAIGVGAGLLVALGLRRHAVRRLGGITGDVLGALVEVAATAALLVVTAQP